MFELELVFGLLLDEKDEHVDVIEGVSQFGLLEPSLMKRKNWLFFKKSFYLKILKKCLFTVENRHRAQRRLYCITKS